MHALPLAGGVAAWICCGVAAAQPATTKSPVDGAEMVLVPAGAFTYGFDQGEIRSLLRRLKAPWDANIYPYEFPRQTKSLPAFYIDRFEVTNELYAKFVRATKHRPSRYARYPQLNAPRQPVVGVGWADAEAYCAWAGKRLPTEEEWEKAARGTDGRRWPWGDDADAQRFNGRASENFAPVEVGRYPKGNSPYGAADMAGNVWEMTSGAWRDGSKAMRGGSFLNTLPDARTSVRWAAASDSASNGANWLGFRCAMNAR